MAAQLFPDSLRNRMERTITKYLAKVFIKAKVVTKEKCTVIKCKSVHMRITLKPEPGHVVAKVRRFGHKNRDVQVSRQDKLADLPDRLFA